MYALEVVFSECLTICELQTHTIPISIHAIIVCDGYLKAVYMNNPHSLQELKDVTWREIASISRWGPCHMSRSISARCETCLQAAGWHFETYIWNLNWRGKWTPHFWHVQALCVVLLVWQLCTVIRHATKDSCNVSDAGSDVCCKLLRWCCRNVLWIDHFHISLQQTSLRFPPV